MGQTLFSRVVATHSFVNFPHYIVSFIWSEAPQVGHSVAPSIQLLIEDCVPVGLIPQPSGLVLVFGDLPFGQVFQDQIDPASRISHGHDVVDGLAYVGLRKELDQRLSESIILNPSGQTICLSVLDSRDLLNLEPFETFQLFSNNIYVRCHIFALSLVVSSNLVND